MSVLVQTRAGAVRGVTQDGISVFRGIPFAAPPVGPRRFQAPESAQPWDGIREADVFGPPPPQSRAGLPPNAVPAGHASAITTPADLTPFTPEDLDEARSRLTRLGQIFTIRLRQLSDAQLDRRDVDAWSVRQIVFHLQESLYYAEAVGRVS
jgi:hypothetical protein